MDISLDRLRREGRQLTPHHWLVDHLIVFVESLSNNYKGEAKESATTTRVVATVTCREHFCSSLNNKWLAYASPDGTINVVRDNKVITATLQRVDPVIRIDYVDNVTGAVWFCVQSGTWQRWVWAWNHNVKTATQANLVKGPDVTEEYKQRVFTAREELHKTASVYAYRKAAGEYWIHNDQARQTDVRIEFEPTWYDLATSSFVALNETDSEDEEEDDNQVDVSVTDENEEKQERFATIVEEEEASQPDEDQEEEASQLDEDQGERPKSTKKLEEEEEEEQQQQDQDEEEEQMVVLPA